MQGWIRSAVLCWLLSCSLCTWAAGEATPIRIGLTSVFLDDETSLISAWRRYLERELKQPVAFVQRASYGEIMDQIRTGKLDFAWVCGYPYVSNKQFVKLLAVPIYQGRMTYRAYLIVPEADRQTKSLLDLRNKVFAFSEPDSNSGHMSIVHELYRIDEKPGAFFSKTFFTWSHRKVVQAVADEVAQGGSVAGYVWDMLARRSDGLTARTRVVQQSAEFGFPPFVASKAVTPAETAAMRKALLGMPHDAEGRRLLHGLGLDGFSAGDDRLFDDIAEIMRIADKKRHVSGP